MSAFRLPILAALALAGCGSGEPPDEPAAGIGAAPDAVPTEADLAADAALANQAAADEAADTHLYGGNAAAMDANRR